jgi:hypothetical protein
MNRATVRPDAARANSIETLALTFALIEVEQIDHPGYERDIADSILCSELRKIEIEETPLPAGIAAIDFIADNWRHVVGGWEEIG